VKKNWGWMEDESKNWNFDDFGECEIRLTWRGWSNWRYFHFKGWRMSWPEKWPNGYFTRDAKFCGWVELGVISIWYADGRRAQYISDDTLNLLRRFRQ